MNKYTQIYSSDLQLSIARLRKKYIPVIAKHEAQKNKIELNLLEKKEFKAEIEEILVDEDTKHDNNNNIIMLLDKQKMNSIKNKVKDLEKITTCLMNNKEFYKELQ